MTLRSVLPVLVTVVLSSAALVAQEQFTLLASFTDQSTGKPVERWRRPI